MQREFYDMKYGRYTPMKGNEWVSVAVFIIVVTSTMHLDFKIDTLETRRRFLLLTSSSLEAG